MMIDEVDIFNGKVPIQELFMVPQNPRLNSPKLFMKMIKENEDDL